MHTHVCGQETAREGLDSDGGRHWSPCASHLCVCVCAWLHECTQQTLQHSRAKRHNHQPVMHKTACVKHLYRNVIKFKEEIKE